MRPVRPVAVRAGTAEDSSKSSKSCTLESEDSESEERSPKMRTLRQSQRGRGGGRGAPSFGWSVRKRPKEATARDWLGPLGHSRCQTCPGVSRHDLFGSFARRQLPSPMDARRGMSRPPSPSHRAW